MCKNFESKKEIQNKKSYYEHIIKRFDKVKHSNGNFKISDIRLEMQQIMQNYCPVYRSEEKMIFGKKKLLELLEKFKELK